MNIQWLSGPRSVGIGVRNYLILVNADNCRVERIVESPPEGTVDDKVLYAALETKWHELVKTYTWPEFDIISGRGHLQQISDALPAYNGWEAVEPERLLQSRGPSLADLFGSESER